MGNEALKPCPFCGGDNCGASAESIEAWNTRAPASVGDIPAWPGEGAAMPAVSAIDDIVAERKRQIVEGWTAEHNDEHVGGALAMAAATYAVSDKIGAAIRDPYLALLWPFAMKWWKPRDRRRDLICSAALIVAEIERLDRGASAGTQP